GEVGEVLSERSGGRGAGRLAERVERDLHLGPLQETPPTAYAERHPGTAEGFFERSGLCVDAVEHGDAPPRQLGTVRAAHRAGDATGLGLVGVVLGDAWRGTVGTGRAHCGAATRRPEHRARGRDHLRSGAVVAT